MRILVYIDKYFILYHSFLKTLGRMISDILYWSWVSAFSTSDPPPDLVTNWDWRFPCLHPSYYDPWARPLYPKPLSGFFNEFHNGSNDPSILAAPVMRILVKALRSECAANSWQPWFLHCSTNSCFWQTSVHDFSVFLDFLVCEYYIAWFIKRKCPKFI